MAILGVSSLTGCSSIPNFIGTGFLMLFQQTSAPTGWTKQTTHNDKALRVVTGTATPGGTSSFSSVFTASRGPFPGTVGNTTLSTPQIPSHTHTIGNFSQTGSWSGFNEGGFSFDTDLQPGPGQSGPGPAVGGGSHSHPFSTGTVNFAVQYVDLIICSKN